MRKMLKPKVSSLRRAINFFTPFNSPPKEASGCYDQIAGVRTKVVSWNNQQPERVVLFIHGGGFSLCSPETHANIMAHLAKYANAIVYGPQYGLSPENKFPVALHQCFDVYLEIRKIHPDMSVFIGGDSAGGNLAAAICVMLDQKNFKKPHGIFLLSPWLDLRRDSVSNRLNKKAQSVFDKGDMDDYARQYCNESQRLHPLVSPFLANPAVFPPVLIQATDNEYLFYDAKAFEEKLRGEGHRVTTQYYTKLFHAWQVFPAFVSQAREALQKVAVFMIETEKAPNS